MICPYYKNKSVFDGFNEIVQALGGSPMTEEEFTSSQLRMQRTGIDFDAVNAAYRLYDMNNGNMLDFAPNGAESNLFKTLLQYFGDRETAIRAKSSFFSDEFSQWKTDNISTDQNGEVQLSDINGVLVCVKQDKLDDNIKEYLSIGSDGQFTYSNRQQNDYKSTIDKHIRLVNQDDFFDFFVLSKLRSNKEVNSSDIISYLLNKDYFSNSNITLAEVLQKHNFPVIYQKLPNGKPLATREYENGSILIEIDLNQIEKYSNERVSEYILHEIIHGLSIQAIKNPKSVEEQNFSNDTKKLYTIFDELMPEYEYDRSDIHNGSYILEDVYEFAAVFATDENAKQMLYKKAYEEDKKGNNKFLLRLKNFINSFSRFLVNKNVFNNIKADQLKLYEKKITDFIKTKKSQYNKDFDVIKAFSDAYESLNDNVLNTQSTAQYSEDLYRRSMSFVRHYVEAEPEQQYDARSNQELWEIRVKIIEALTTRLAAINSSTIEEDLKLKSGQIVREQLSQFKDYTKSTALVLSSFLQDVVPQLVDDVLNISTIEETSHSLYMYNMHDNFGAYQAILTRLRVDLGNRVAKDQLAEEFRSITGIDKLSLTKDIKDIISLVNKGANLAAEGCSYMYNILLNNLRRDLEKVGEEVNFSNTKFLLDSLKHIGFDTNSFINTLGSKDGAEDPIIRSIVYLVNKAIREAKDETIDVATQLLKLSKNLLPGESVLDLYELDENGHTTQYIVRDLNFGIFYNDYKEFINQLNDKYKIPKGQNTTSLTVEKRKQYNIEKNKWLSQHCERRFVPEYYEAYAELSEDTMQAITSIRSAISQIKKLAYDENDKFYHYEKLTDEEWQRLQGLIIQKRLLGSDYTLSGALKMEGTDAYRMAKEIQKLNEKLYSDESKIKRAYEQWQNKRNQVIQDSISRHTKNDGQVDMNAVSKDVYKWDERNSKRALKKNGDKIEVFQEIERETKKIVGFDKPIYEQDEDGGSTYEQNNKRINQILNIFRDFNTGEINLFLLPAAVKGVVTKLQKENKAIKAKAKQKGGKQFREQVKLWDDTYQKVFDKYLQSRTSSYYRKLFSSSDGLPILPVAGVKSRPKKWETIITVNAPYIEEYTELLPGDGWIDMEERTDLLNPEYAKYNMNVPYIPKKVLSDGSTRYDNSVAYNKIKNSPTLNALYVALVGDKDSDKQGIMQKANSKLFIRNYQDDYLLPGKTGSMWKYMKSHNLHGRVTAALNYVKDHAGFTSQGIRQDQSFGAYIKEALVQVSDLQEIVEEDSSFGNKQTGTRPDGRSFNIIPTYYSKRLDDPSQLSSDLIGIVCDYFENASMFEHKSEIKDFIESLVDATERRRYEIKNENDGSVAIIRGENSKSFAGAKKFVEMNLYNIRSSNKQIGNLNLGRTAQNFSRLTQALNLGMSPAVALTGFFTAQYSHLINAIVGDKSYGLEEYSQATGEIIQHFIRNYAGIGYASNQLSNDKVMLLAEMFDVANQRKRKFTFSNRSRIVRFLDNWCFGGLTSIDFMSKSTIMVTILMSHRYMDGQFLSKEDVLNKLESSTEEGKNKLLAEWEKGKVLYSIFKPQDGELIIDPKYKEVFEKSRHKIYSRINKTAESADGMATETQKAAITTNFFGAAVLTHRQYLPLMLQSRFLPAVWDFDMQMYVQGTYIIGWEFFKNVLYQSTVDKIKGQSFLDALKHNWKEFTYDTSSEEAWKISRARKKALKRIVTEQIVFHSLVVPLVSLICLFADGDDQKDALALQLAAYIARRTQWETYTPYRWDDILNNIKSVSAQTGTLDKFDAFFNMVSRRLFPRSSLLDTLLGLHGGKPLSDRITRGVYKGWLRDYKVLMQMTPLHNLYEQWYGSKMKRMYYEKQIMQLDD